MPDSGMTAGRALSALALILVASVSSFGDPMVGKKPIAFDPDTVVFIGSSTIHKWTTLKNDFRGIKTLNLGVDATDFPFLMTNAPDWATKYPAKRFVIYSGDNDITAGKSPEDVAKDFKSTIDILHSQLPHAYLYVFSIKPCPAPDRKAKLAQITAANRLISKIASQEKNVTFIDIFTEMITPNGIPKEGLFTDDGVHMNDLGYAIWTKALRPLIMPKKPLGYLDHDPLKLRSLNFETHVAFE
jgi:hypothetical protein